MRIDAVEEKSMTKTSTKEDDLLADQPLVTECT
jgi:hypothetical protein